ncbi:hypothetical protein CcrColossus_gp303 [Caulobacter phage CcrColossus]|uniref:Uncharacterized protein n=1 Tax=Caulobacter phage CcrColossus TaxID=1211640 RepID=K4JW94_9CAUD|nr:hypothetical protein CcrColossus_gp303 [Caulobacter phage CcrColossus]AFU88173.1 hypothetical protein CcrColossus_gp303 [Caulobacter phage CcrColossus]
MRFHNLHLGIDYDDAYRAVTVTLRDGTEVRFESGDPPADFAKAVEYARGECVRIGCNVMTSSSLDSFVFDVPGWKYNNEDMLIRDPRDHIASVAEVMSGCPMEWEGLLEDGTHFYARYRDGRFRVGFGETNIQAVDHAVSNDKGYTAQIGEHLEGHLTWAEALPHFNQALLKRAGYAVDQDDE